MFRFYVRLALLLTLLLLVFSAAMLALGGAQPINPALRGFVEGCDQLCWFGVVPGVTTMDEARRLLEEQGYIINTLGGNPSVFQAVHQSPAYCYAAVSESSESDNIVSTISLFNCHDVSLGDLTAVLGTPTSITVCRYNAAYQIEFHFGASVGARDFSLIPQSGAISLYQSPEIISLLGGDRGEGYWQGLIPLWRYYQSTVQPFIYTCF